MCARLVARVALAHVVQFGDGEREREREREREPERERVTQEGRCGGGGG